MTVDIPRSAHRPLRPVSPVVTTRDTGTTVTSRGGGRRLTLARGQIFAIPRQSGIRSIEVLHGTCWLTATPANRDILLSTGDQFPIGSNTPYVLEALGEAELTLSSLICLNLS